MKELPTHVYASRLVTIANTRLLFNTTAELEDFLDIRGIRTNGILRCCPTPQRVRATYRDLDDESRIQSDGQFSLSWLLPCYEAATDFYKQRLARRRDPETIATRLLDLYFNAPMRRRPSPTIAAIYRDMMERDINPFILLLLMLKAIPGYDSKTGDVTDIDQQFEKVMRFLSVYTRDELFGEAPVVKAVQNETTRTRLTLIRHTLNILGTHEAYSTPDYLNQTVERLKQGIIDLDINGFWTSSLDKRTFWHIQAANNTGAYFATLYTREGPLMLTASHYVFNLFSESSDRMVAYVQGPEAMKHLITKHKFADGDVAWYIAPKYDSDAPQSLSFMLYIPTPLWPERIELTRVTDPLTVNRLQHEIDCHPVEQLYQDAQYTLSIGIFAITRQAAYILDETDQSFYRIPFFTSHKFESITLSDNIGILTMGGRRYLAIDEHLLYIPISPAATAPRHLRRYGITRITDLPAAILADLRISTQSDKDIAST